MATIATLVIHQDEITAGTVVSRLVVIGLVVAVALYLRARADYINGLKERAERLERERELLSQQAVGDERVRIARELHDVVAHNVSLMVVQAQALAATGPQVTQHETLGHVADLGREALSEMHRMLGVLRLQDGGAPELEPQPGVRDLPTLIERTRQAGLRGHAHRRWGAAGAAGRRGPLGVPHRPGGAHQRHPPRPCRATRRSRWATPPTRWR